MDTSTMEAQAVDLYDRGEYQAACDIFGELSRKTDSETAKDIYKFNIASCQGSQGDHMAAFNHLFEGPTRDDREDLHNKILCLIGLDRLDLALPLLDIMSGAAREDKMPSGDLVAQLLIDCMDNLECAKLTMKQCRILEALLTDNRSQIIELRGEQLWSKNYAHVLFETEQRYEECVKLYETLLDDNGEDPGANEPRDLLMVDPEVLANLCVSYILTGRNRDAEELIKETEEAEEAAEQSFVNGESDSPGMSHLVHLNLAVGTLYCIKGNHEFGLSRIFKCLEPLERNLSRQGWQQAKECILSTLDKHCKQLIFIKDDLFNQMISFLVQCEVHGADVGTSTEPEDFARQNSVTHEARYLRATILEIFHDG